MEPHLVWGGMITIDHVRKNRSRLLDALTHAMDHTSWTPCSTAHGITVSNAHPVYAPGESPHTVEGFLIASELDGITVDHGLAYFHDACHFADTANAMTSASEIVQVLDDRLEHYEAIVRTGFKLPWPLQDREFLHYVTTWRGRDAQGRDTALIAYDTVDDPSLPPPWPGTLRCPMKPSGQRVTDLGGGRVRFEHCMTYDLVGWIGPRVQDRLFHAGHVKAYAEEWRQAMATLKAESRHAPLRAGRGEREARWAKAS